MSNTQTVVTPVERTITVDCPVEHAFETFTARIGDWWPLGFHSISVDEDGKGPPETAVMEGRTGGRIYERTSAGEELDWGKVLVWEPPARVVLEWSPSRKPATPTEIDVRFTAEGTGTRVDLVHRGWERLGPRASEVRSGYSEGWPIVLGLFAQAAGSK